MSVLEVAAASFDIPIIGSVSGGLQKAGIFIATLFFFRIVYDSFFFFLEFFQFLFRGFICHTIWSTIHLFTFTR